LKRCQRVRKLLDHALLYSQRHWANWQRWCATQGFPQASKAISSSAKLWNRVEQACQCDSRRRAGSSGRLLHLLLKTRTAQHGPPLRRPEGNRGLRAALRTSCLGFRAHSATATALLGLALLAALGVVSELLLVEKNLLSGGKDKLFAAVAALQISINEFHGRLPRRQGIHRNRPFLKSCRSRFPVVVRRSEQGPGPQCVLRLKLLSTPQIGGLQQQQ